MREISVFVDESGDFGEYEKHSPYYIVTMVFHDQSKDIRQDIIKLDRELKNLGYNNPVIHTEPLIRKEEDYTNMQPNERRAILSRLFFFTLHADISFKTFLYDKREFDTILKLEARMARDLSQFLRSNLEYMQSFDHVILYYDNGQRELTRILNVALATELSNYDVRKVFPWEYKLFQVADLICTLKLTERKVERQGMSRSEQYIFHSKRDLYKDYLKPISRKEWDSIKHT